MNDEIKIKTHNIVLDASVFWFATIRIYREMNKEKLEIQRYNIIDYLQFQDLIADTFNYRDHVNSYTNHGRNGQKQNSVDISSNETKTAINTKRTNSVKKITQ